VKIFTTSKQKLQPKGLFVYGKPDSEQQTTI